MPRTVLLIVPYGIETSNEQRDPFCVLLLIVPYGIETMVHTSGFYFGRYLLIVPYGIETKTTHISSPRTELLIVPYGIETDKIYTEEEREKLLIVPYGIETRDFSLYKLYDVSFNRTLWN